MQGRATAPVADTVMNALETGVGSAFAMDADTTATVSHDRDGAPARNDGDRGSSDRGDDEFLGVIDACWPERDGDVWRTPTRPDWRTLTLPDAARIL